LSGILDITRIIDIAASVDQRRVDVTHTTLAVLTVALALYLAGPQVLLRTPSAASAAEKEYIFADLVRLCDSVSGKQWPSYYSKGNISIRDELCIISDLIVFSEKNAIKMTKLLSFLVYGKLYVTNLRLKPTKGR
jgi:hypothetical protein